MSPTPKQQHTATPWEVTESGDFLEVMQEDGASITQMIGTDDQALADAEFIVRAVNSHDALVAALAWTERLAEVFARDEWDSEEVYNFPFGVMLAEFNAALALAREG